jgi:outer membrane protein assembly factor BamA
MKIRRARQGCGASVLLVVGLVLGWVDGAAAAGPRLDYRGSVPTPGEAEALLAPALRSPPDTTALSAALGALVERLEAEGYLDARAHARWVPGDPARLELDVVAGERYRVRSIVVQALAPGDSLLLVRSLGIARGDWASPPRVSQAVDAALRAVVDSGYAYAQLGVSGWDADSSGLALSLSGGLGPRVAITSVRFEGLRVTRPALLRKVAGRLAGFPYNRSAAEAARDRVDQLGLFRRVDLVGLEGEGDWSRAALVYRVEEPAFNRFEGAVGAQGAAGLVGLARLDMENLAGTGRALGVSWESSRRRVANFSARYAEPLLFGAPIRLEGTLEQQVQDTLYTRTRWGASARLALSAEERIEIGYEQDRVVQEFGSVEQAGTQTTRFGIERRKLDSRSVPRRGTVLGVSASQSFRREVLRPAGRHSARSSAVELAAEWHRPLAARSGVALELRGAGRFSSERVLPFFERYPLGGATTLRGYDEEQFRVDRYALSRLEWRWFPGGADAFTFLFWDHAAAATRLETPGGDRLQRLQRDGVGFGISLETGTGRIRVDYGLAPGASPLDGKIHLRIVSAF